MNEWKGFIAACVRDGICGNHEKPHSSRTREEAPDERSRSKSTQTTENEDIEHYESFQDDKLNVYKDRFAYNVWHDLTLGVTYGDKNDLPPPLSHITIIHEKMRQSSDCIHLEKQIGLRDIDDNYDAIAESLIGLNYLSDDATSPRNADIWRRKVPPVLEMEVNNVDRDCASWSSVDTPIVLVDFPPCQSTEQNRLRYDRNCRNQDFPLSKDVNGRASDSKSNNSKTKPLSFSTRSSDRKANDEIEVDDSDTVSTLSSVFTEAFEQDRETFGQGTRPIGGWSLPPVLDHNTSERVERKGVVESLWKTCSASPLLGPFTNTVERKVNVDGTPERDEYKIMDPGSSIVDPPVLNSTSNRSRGLQYPLMSLPLSGGGSLAVSGTSANSSSYVSKGAANDGRYDDGSSYSSLHRTLRGGSI